MEKLLHGGAGVEVGLGVFVGVGVSVAGIWVAVGSCVCVGVGVSVAGIWVAVGSGVCVGGALVSVGVGSFGRGVCVACVHAASSSKRASMYIFFIGWRSFFDYFLRKLGVAPGWCYCTRIWGVRQNA